MTDADVLVAGAGLVGATAALGLAELGCRVIVIEPRPPARRPGASGFEARTAALNPAARELIERYADWERLKAHPFRTMRVWEEAGTRDITFAAEEVGRDALGWIVEVGRASEVLWSALQLAEGVRSHVGASVEGIKGCADGLEVRAGGDTFRVRLLIGADGGTSTVRSLAGGDAEVQPTPHAALATVVTTERDSGGAALQCFLEDGPLALLPLSGDGDRGRSSVVWSQPRDAARRRAEMDEELFARELERASEGVLGEVLACDARFVFDLDQRIADSFQPQQRCLLVGDAARVLHPLAGQGLNVGLEDVKELLSTARVRSGEFRADPGAPTLWRAFARRRRAKAILMLQLMDGFRLGYAVNDPLLRLLRNVGVTALDANPLLKHQLIREAMGLGLSA